MNFDEDFVLLYGPGGIAVVPREKAGVWQVLRHGGRSRDTWRVAASGTEEKARRKYAKIAEDLRQGGVRLISPDGQQIAATGGPRLRTRW